MTEISVDSIRSPTIAASGALALASQLLLVGLAVALPVLAHRMGLPVRMLLPMHWPVLLAGIVFGWRGGAAVGAAVPLASFALSGFPLPNILPSMVPEVATYGAVAGFARERMGLSGMMSVAMAVLAGRVVFVGFVLMTGGSEGATAAYFSAALAPGMWAAVAQVGLLPAIGAAWIRWDRNRPGQG